MIDYSDEIKIVHDKYKSECVFNYLVLTTIGLLPEISSVINGLYVYDDIIKLKYNIKISRITELKYITAMCEDHGINIYDDITPLINNNSSIDEFESLFSILITRYYHITNSTEDTYRKLFSDPMKEDIIDELSMK